MPLEIRSSLQPLLHSSTGLHVTIYAVNRGDLNDLKEQLHRAIDAAQSFVDPVLNKQESDRFLQPLRALLQDRRLLKSLNGNLGIFRNMNTFRLIKIPVEVQEMLVVATSFHVKPLLRWMQLDRDFLLLGLGQGKAHLYQGNQFTLRRIEVCGNRDLHHNRAWPELLSAKGLDPSLKLHEQLTWINEWLGKQAGPMRPKLFVVGDRKLAEKALVGLEYPQNLKPSLVQKFHPDRLGEICFDIRRTLKNEAHLAMEQAFMEFYQAIDNRLAQKNIHKIARAASQGLVSKLIVADQIQIFGKLDTVNGQIAIHGHHRDHEDDDILDDLAQLVLAKGGDVLVAAPNQIPQGRAALAILKHQGSDARQRLEIADEWAPWRSLSSEIERLSYELHQSAASQGQRA